MNRATQRRLLRFCQLGFGLGLIAAVSWNLVAIFLSLNAWWPALLLPLPGLLGWLGLSAIHPLSSRLTVERPHTYRLLYNAPDSWSDDRARQALLTLIHSGIGLDIVWAREGEELGCWLAVSGHGAVLERLVRDVFPGGTTEAAPLPAIGAGAAILHWAATPPAPAELCQTDGIDGVYVRRRSTESAIVVIWGPAAEDAARELAHDGDWRPGQGRTLLAPSSQGDNPWPQLPPFPPSQNQPGLSAISRLARLAPALRVADRPALILGQDAAAQPVGFALPDLEGMELGYLTGQSTEAVVINLVQQAVQAHQPVLLLDGQGVVTTRLARRLLREVAGEQVLLCDVERPGQSRFRLNPLWLPDDPEGRARALATGWLAWLREQGVTAAGLGQAAARHTQIAIVLAALVAAERQMTLDVPGLREALLAPDFLKLVPEGVWSGSDILTADIWQWWRGVGRAASSFDTHLRLAHLRDRLGTLLALPEYSVLWRGPYLEPLAALSSGKSLFWRLPDPRRRLRPYITSQLLALHTILTAWPQDAPPLLVVLHELDAGSWVERLHAFAKARLVLAADQPASLPTTLRPSSLLVSRLPGDIPAWLQALLPDIRYTDLRRLPPHRLVFKQEEELCTLDMKGE